MFEETQLDVLEDVGKPIIVCVHLIGGNLMLQPATFTIFSQMGSAQGIYIDNGLLLFRISQIHFKSGHFTNQNTSLIRTPGKLTNQDALLIRTPYPSRYLIIQDIKNSCVYT